MSTKHQSSHSNLIPAVTLLLAILITIGIVILPAWLIYPFRKQTEMEILISHLLRSLSPFLSIFLLLVALFLTRRLWGGRWLRKIALALGIAVIAVATWFSFQNHFEWFFHPLPDPAYARISQADFMTDQDMVLAIRINGESAAYPVRFLAYHHIVMDEVGGRPIVATY